MHLFKKNKDLDVHTSQAQKQYYCDVIFITKNNANLN